MPKKPVTPKKPAKFVPPKVPDRVKAFMALIQKPDEAPLILIEMSMAHHMVHFEDGFKDRIKAMQPAFYFGRSWRGSDMFRVVDRFGKLQANVVLYPELTFEPYTRTRRNVAADLVKAGAKVSFVPRFDSEREYRSLLPQVASLVRNGLSREAALAGLTKNPAEVIGLGAELGLIKKGYKADLVFLSGDPLAPGTKVTRVMFDGKQSWPETKRKGGGR